MKIISICIRGVFWTVYEYSPMSKVVGSILNHEETDHNRHDQSNNVDHQAGKNHEGGIASASSPCLVSSAGFPVADVEHGEC
jgi:hypothetical protein